MYHITRESASYLYCHNYAECALALPAVAQDSYRQRRDHNCATLVAWTTDRLVRFMSARRTMIRYPEFRERGWQIGSGPTESQCKLCTKRLKGYGRRWDRPNATAVAALDTLDRNGQWRQVWPNASYTTT